MLPPLLACTALDLGHVRCCCCRSLLAAVEHEGQAGKVLGLLKQLADSGEVTQTQMAKGFGRIDSRLADVALDLPRAPELFQQYRHEALEQGWLTVA
jgi:hypothetical protein